MLESHSTIAKQYLSKGDRVNVSGELEFQQWEYEKRIYSKYVVNNVNLDLLPKKNSSNIPHPIVKPAYNKAANISVDSGNNRNADLPETQGFDGNHDPISF